MGCGLGSRVRDASISLSYIEELEMGRIEYHILRRQYYNILDKVVNSFHLYLEEKFLAITLLEKKSVLKKYIFKY